MLLLQPRRESQHRLVDVLVTVLCRLEPQHILWSLYILGDSWRDGEERAITGFGVGSVLFELVEEIHSVGAFAALDVDGGSCQTADEGVVGGYTGAGIDVC